MKFIAIGVLLNLLLFKTFFKVFIIFGELVVVNSMMQISTKRIMLSKQLTCLTLDQRVFHSTQLGTLHWRAYKNKQPAIKPLYNIAHFVQQDYVQM